MSNRLQIRRTSTPGKVPALSDLLLAELGINLIDKALFINDGTTVVQLNSAANTATDETHRFVTDAQIASWSTAYELPVAEAAVLGGVKIGSNVDVDANGVISIKTANGTDAGVLSAVDYNAFNGKQDALGFTPVNRAGDTMEGALTLVGAPTLTNHAANMGYVDSGLAAKLALAGGTMSGLLVLSADPEQALGAATRQYVDNATNMISGRYAAPTQDVTELAALVSGTLVDKQMRLVEDSAAIFRYDAQSAEVANGTSVIVPDDTPATGRWIKMQSATQSHESLNDLLGGAVNDHLHLTTAEKNGYDAHLADYDLHLTPAQNTFIDAINASAAELNFLVGTTSNVQDQLDGKQASLGFTPVNVAGDTMTGSLLLSQDPVAAMEAVTLQFLQGFTVDGGTF